MRILEAAAAIIGIIADIVAITLAWAAWRESRETEARQVGRWLRISQVSATHHFPE